MQKNRVKFEENQTIEALLIKHPEDIFESKTLTYKSGEIQIIINRFSMAKDLREVHRSIMELLNATANFRYATVPVGMFFELRQKNKTDADLKQLLDNLYKHFCTVKNKLTGNSISDDDKTMMMQALNYCRHSVYERINSLTLNDRLLPLWDSSEIKSHLE